MAFFASQRQFERALMSALSDLQAAVALNSTLVASLISLEASKSTPVGTSDADIAAVTATVTQNNQAIQSVLTPPAAPAPAVTPAAAS